MKNSVFIQFSLNDETSIILSWYPSLDDILNSRIYLDNNDHNKVDSIRLAVKGN